MTRMPGAAPGCTWPSWAGCTWPLWADCTWPLWADCSWPLGAGCMWPMGLDFSELRGEVIIDLDPERVFVDHNGHHRFLSHVLMAHDSSHAVDGNIARPTHDFRRHIHGELYAVAYLRQIGGCEQKAIGGDVSCRSFDYPILRLQMERKPEREADSGPDGIPRSKLLPNGQDSSFGEPIIAPHRAVWLPKFMLLDHCATHHLGTMTH